MNILDEPGRDVARKAVPASQIPKRSYIRQGEGKPELVSFLT
jgi:hypothetical protein